MTTRRIENNIQISKPVVNPFNSIAVSFLNILVVILMFLLPKSLLGQEKQRSINVRYISDTINLDGMLDEDAWQTADKGGDFWQYFPTDSALSVNATEFRLLYDDHNLYIGIRAEVKSDNYMVSSLRRDFTGIGNDHVTLIFDTYKDGNIAFMFGMTPYGVQHDQYVSGGGSNQNSLNRTWDQKWLLESKMYDDHYVLEAAIPFSSLKFREGETSWRVQCFRGDMQTSERSVWIRVPQNQTVTNLAFMGDMIFEKPLGKSRTPFAIIPYVNALASKDFSSELRDNKIAFGGDAKVAIGNSMNLDITVNPDFSNVEVDDIFTNLTRFEVLLPEKRQFFIDNNDLFGSYGDLYNQTNPFFSRRIGLASDKDGNTIENRILGGVRLSGKLNEDWRLGVLNIQTGEDIENEIASNNNMMLAVQKKMFSRSNVGIFFINRQTFKDYDFQDSTETYNRVIGIDYNLASADNKWTGKFYLHKSFQPDDKKGNYSAQATTAYLRRGLRWIIDFVYVDEDFHSDLGYIQRTGVFRWGNNLKFMFYPKKGIVNQHGPGGEILHYWKPDSDFMQTDHRYQLYYEVSFKNQSTLNANVSNNYVYLTFDFDPTRSEGIPVQGKQGYTYNQFSIRYRSNPVKVISFNAESSGGQFYTGQNFTAGGELTFRIQPWALLSLNIRYDAIRLPDPHSDADYWLVTPKAEISFSKSVFWSTLVQYSNQRDNLGINSRLQWRFAPLSDLYLVYNDNYFTNNFTPRFRSINLKLTYWLDI